MNEIIPTSISFAICPHVIVSEIGIEQCIILDLTDTSASNHIASGIMCVKVGNGESCWWFPLFAIRIIIGSEAVF